MFSVQVPKYAHEGSDFARAIARFETADKAEQEAARLRATRLYRWVEVRAEC